MTADRLAEIKRLYFKTTRATIDRDFDRAIDLLKEMPEDETPPRHGLHGGAGGDAEGIQARTEVSLSPSVPSRPAFSP